ncbi:hypothetical protein FBU30_009068 [Linnemannia zychae]|nr:hypothetical protein FBU30_009068 [Linnemannia zychae]
MGGHSSINDWFTIQLNDPYIIIPDANTISTSSSESRTDGRLIGTVLIRVSKPTKVKSLTLAFTGIARTTFYFDSSKIPGARTCVASDKHQYECILLEQSETFLSPHNHTHNNIGPHILSAGTHRFAFTFTLHDRHPAIISSKAINIQYRLTASLHLATILPFSSSHVISRPVAVLQRDELPSDNLFNTKVLQVATQKSNRLSGHISIPCSVIPHSSTIPLLLNLGLQGNGSSLTKITIELFERILAIERDSSKSDKLLSERLVTRQNCPIRDWSGSTINEPVMISKRLLFKVPQLPLSAWSSVHSEEVTSLSSYRANLEKGFCHPSGDYQLGSLSASDDSSDNNGKAIRIQHLIRFTFQIRGFPDPPSSDPNKIETEFLQKETNVWIVGNQEYHEDDTLPPSYYRSFSTTLVDTDDIPEMDRRAMEALQDDLPDCLPPPCYEDCLAHLTPTISGSTTAGSLSSSSRSSSVSSSPTLASWYPSAEGTREIMHHIGTNVSHFNLSDSHAGVDTYAYDLQMYTSRYSHANPTAVFAT